MEYTEDDLTSELIKKTQEPSVDDDLKISSVETECHYNNYGSRGYVDLVVEKKYQSQYEAEYLHLYEIKSDLTKYSANEVVRQFTKMYENFVPGSKFRGAKNPSIELCVIPSVENYKWILENREMIRNIFEKYDYSRVTFRHPNDTSPVHVFTSSISIGEDNFWEHAKTNTEVYDSIKAARGVTSDE